MEIKAIDVNAKEWFDKVNGNSYFSGVIWLNYGTKKQSFLKMPFQYGYGNHYVDMACQQLAKGGFIKLTRNENGSYTPLWQYCKANKIILRTNKQENCKKRDLN